MTSGFEGLDPCVHCGFCLSACPTYLVTGDEADSPRGRIVLMRALERGELPASDDVLAAHLDACLGCRGCEPACPSGVAYGSGLETARAILAAKRGLGGIARTVLGFFARPALWSPIFAISRFVRSTRIARLLAGGSRPGFMFGMLEATRSPAPPSAMTRKPERRPVPARGPVALFTGCVMQGLFSHVHEATRRTLAANGFKVVEVREQQCCGALHLHAGDRDGALRLARKNLDAFREFSGCIAVNSAGCGAMLRETGHLLDTDEARSMAARVRDASELLAEAGPLTGGQLHLRAAYDAPCHLQHAQRVHAEVLQVLEAVPGLKLELREGYDQCCGSAGIFSLMQPEMSRMVLQRKIGLMTTDAPDLILTGNPGCLMQIGAGLLAAGSRSRTAHPVEVLDWSYRAAGYYGKEASGSTLRVRDRQHG